MALFKNVFIIQNMIYRIMESSSPRYIFDENGDKISVILPVSEYQQTQRDLHDLTVIAERKNEDTRSMSEIKKKPGKNCMWYQEKRDGC